MKPRNMLLGALIFVNGLFTLEQSIAKERSIKEINELLTEEKSELRILKNKIQRRNKRIFSVGAKESSILKNLGQIENRLKLKERELQIYKWNIEINKRRVAKLSSSIIDTESDMVSKKREFGNWLRMIYKEGGLVPVKVIFSANGITDMLQRLKFVDMVTEYDAQIFKTYDEDLKKFSRQKDSLLQVRSNLVLLQEDAVNKKLEINERKKEKLGFLKKLKKQRSFNIQIQNELKAASELLSKLISEQELKLEKGENFNIYDHKGRLSLPVKGKILNQFGKKRDKRYKSYMVFNGVNIRSAKNTSVRAIYSGKVLHTGFLEGYGNLVILGHGDQFHSIYGYLDKILCKVGKNIRKGQIIAKSGDSNSVVGDALYFELRKNGKAIDPLSWFRLANK